MDELLLILIRLIFLLVFCIESAYLTRYLATLKGYTPKSWFIIGFFCGILGLITAVGLPLKKNIDEAQDSEKKSDRRGSENMSKTN